MKIDDTGSPAPLTTRLGALVEGSRTLFRVWSPHATRLDVVLESGDVFPMHPISRGVHEISVDGLPEGTLYRLRMDGGEALPDPASRFQPQGIHGPSMIVDPGRFEWHDDAWAGVSLEDLVFYEAHVGTFSPEGTFDGLRSRLPYLKALGVTAVELMPVADFPGRWNWGYDHAALYAPSRAYGTPDDLRRLVDEAHGLGLAVFLDVIYNHLGPDGAYVAAFAPMFTDKHTTPWGMAINLDDEHSEGVRNLFVDNALTWLREFHVDGLRLDATHAIVDDSPTHFLAELADRIGQMHESPKRIAIAEDNRNDVMLILPRDRGGYGLDAVWSDDFHHQVRHLTAGDSEGYFAEFVGLRAEALADTVNRGWHYDGRRSKSTGKLRGTDPSLIEPSQCVICIQNHDQIGNRPFGDRLHHTIPAPVYRAVSSLLLFAPELPLLFMGQEWAARTPFQFFTDHHEELGKLVSEGRRKEFEQFSGFGGDVPDPQDPETFDRSRLNWAECDDPFHAGFLTLYRDLLAVRRRLRGPADAVAYGPYALGVRRGSFQLLVALRDDERMPAPGDHLVVLATEDAKYAGSGTRPVHADGMVHFAVSGAQILGRETVSLPTDTLAVP